MSTILNGWHRGERIIHDKLDLSGVMAQSYTWITCYMPDQHRLFYAHNLPFVPITSLGADGRPWTSVIAGSSGERGFMQSPKETQLTIDFKMWEGDPLVENLKLFDTGKNTLIAGIGVDFSNRRRNKFAGHITSMRYGSPWDVHLDVDVNQAIG